MAAKGRGLTAGPGFSSKAGSTWMTPRIQWFTHPILLGNNAHRMVTSQPATKELVRANSIPKLYRLSWQPFWGLQYFPLHFFQDRLQLWARSLGIQLVGVSVIPSPMILSHLTWHCRPVLSTPFPLFFLLIARLATWSDWPTVSNFAACMDFWILVHDSWGHLNSVEHEAFSQRSVWET